MKAMVAVVMGVSGSGKTTIAVPLARTLDWMFQEGDALHPPANIAKMKQGMPLNDADRLPWLHRMAEVVDGWLQAGTPGVLSCSVLKRSYRDIVIGGRPGVRLVYLQGSQELIRQRMEARRGHFMPASLLDSQFATLEEPQADEQPLIVSVAGTPEEIVAEIISRLE